MSPVTDELSDRWGCLDSVVVALVFLKLVGATPSVRAVDINSKSGLERSKVKFSRSGGGIAGFGGEDTGMIGFCGIRKIVINTSQ